MDKFRWECRTVVEFGQGKVRETLPEFVRRYAIEGTNIMVGYGSGSVMKNGAYNDVIAALESTGYRKVDAAAASCDATTRVEGVIFEFGGIMANPTLAKMQEGAELARRWNIGLIIAVGGGSVMDCCKGIAVQAVYDGDAWQDFWMDGIPCRKRCA